MFFKANKSALYAIMGVALASTGSAAMADVLVTRSSGAIAREIPRGSRLGDTQTLRLSAGDRVTVLTSGGTRQFNGPGRFRVDGPLRTASGGVTTTGRNGTARTGVSRGPYSAMARNEWQIDTGTAGAFCVVEGQPISLWRGNASTGAQITVTRVADSASTTVAMAEGEYSHAWPESWGAAGGTYMLETAGNPTHTHIEFVPVAVDANDPVAVGEALLSNNCNSQLEAMTANYQIAEATGG